MAVQPLPTSEETGQPLELEIQPTDTQRVAARTLVVYGDSGLGKSTNLMFAAKWLYAQHGKPVRLV